MKNKKLWLGILAMTLVFGMALVGCDGDAGTKDVPVTGVTLNKSSLTLAVGGRETLTATVSPSDATNKAVTWSTSDATKATVVNGTVTAVSAGSATITVTTVDGGRTAQCTVTVTSGSTTPTYSLDGVWESSFGEQVTVSGSTGVISVMGSVNALGQSAIDKGYLGVGTITWRNLTSTGNLTWSGQALLITRNSSNPEVATGTTYYNRTFIMSADGQNLTMKDGTDTVGTYTRKTTHSLDGVWEEVGGNPFVITVSGSTGIFTSIGDTFWNTPLFLDARNKGWHGVGVTGWRNLTKTGDLTWSGQWLAISYNTSNPNVATGQSWNNVTWVLSPDGQTLVGNGSSTWRRKQ